MLNPREILSLPLGSAIVDRAQSAALKVTVESHDPGASLLCAAVAPRKNHFEIGRVPFA